MTDQSMVDQPMEDDEFDGLMDPVEQKQLESLQQVVDALVQVVQGLQTVAGQQAQIVQVLLADREITATGRDGRPMKALSRVSRG